jgi:hypothetical protein
VIDIWGTNKKGEQRGEHAAQKVENGWWTSKMPVGTGDLVGYHISHLWDTFEGSVYRKFIISFKAAPGAANPVLELKKK